MITWKIKGLFISVFTSLATCTIDFSCCCFLSDVVSIIWKRSLWFCCIIYKVVFFMIYRIIHLKTFYPLQLCKDERLDIFEWLFTLFILGLLSSSLLLLSEDFNLPQVYIDFFRDLVLILFCNVQLFLCCFHWAQVHNADQRVKITTTMSPKIRTIARIYCK